MSYDRTDWHLESAIEAGQPEEHAFTHIGLFLAWLIRHDLHDPQLFPDYHIAAVKAGEMTGSDLVDDIDGKLTSAGMSPEGAAFTDASYEAYLDGYAEAFGDLPEYGVGDTPEAYETVERLLDRLYADWVAGGRQPPPSKAHTEPDAEDFGPVEQMILVPPGYSKEQVDLLLADAALPFPGVLNVMSPDSVPRSHVAAHLEALIPIDLSSPPLELESERADRWGSSLLTRALKLLGVSPKDAVVVHAIGGDGEGTVTVSLYAVPAVDAERLVSEFRSVIFRIPGSTWETRSIAGRRVEWAPGTEFTVAFWARDGMVIHMTGRPETIIPAIDRLP